MEIQFLLIKYNHRIEYNRSKKMLVLLHLLSKHKQFKLQGKQCISMFKTNAVFALFQELVGTL